MRSVSACRWRWPPDTKDSIHEPWMCQASTECGRRTVSTPETYPAGRRLNAAGSARRHGYRDTHAPTPSTPTTMPPPLESNESDRQEQRQVVDYPDQDKIR